MLKRFLKEENKQSIIRFDAPECSFKRPQQSIFSLISEYFINKILLLSASRSYLHMSASRSYATYLVFDYRHVYDLRHRLAYQQYYSCMPFMTII